MKSFSTEIYEEVLGKLTFPDYENFSCINEAYSELTSKFFEQSGTTKAIRIKNKTNKWFDGEIADKPPEANCLENFKNLS